MEVESSVVFIIERDNIYILEDITYQKRKIATGGLLQKANYFLLRHTNRIAGGGR